jgi:ABC-type glycerol-3-phosphate transport system substrate-binding protein
MNIFNTALQSIIIGEKNSEQVGQQIQAEKVRQSENK